MIALYIIIAICLLIGILYLMPAFTKPIKDKQGHVVPGSIASLEKVNIGSTQQWILIRGENINNPVILFLHGGPGTSEMCLLRKYTSELEKHFIVVSWDQRGAGKSYPAIHSESDMKIERFIQDAHELTEILRQRFNKQRIFLAGHSWGSVLGVLTVNKYPEIYEAYIGIGQVANMLENEQRSYDYTLEQAGKANDRAIARKLTSFGRPPYSGDWQKKTVTQRRYLGKYGGEFYGSSKGAFPVVIKTLICSTEYTLRDKVNFFRGIFGSMRLLWPELLTVDLEKQVPALKVPVYFLLGRHDYEAAFIPAERYFNMLEAPKKELIWFENSAHMLNIEENKKFEEVMIKRILEE